MACQAIRLFTGAELILLMKGQNIGYFGAAEIQADINSMGANSEMGIAKLDLEQWMTDCGIDCSTLSATACNNLEMGLKWFAIWRYRRFDMEQIKNACDCDENDERALDYACKMVCEFLCKVSTCLKDKFLAFVDQDCKIIDFSDVFTGVVVGKCDTYTPVPIEKKKNVCVDNFNSAASAEVGFDYFFDFYFE